ncbi:MAG: hypothetical protein ACEPOW_11810, partial [Bacteroidales bacterium]
IYLSFPFPRVDDRLVAKDQNDAYALKINKLVNGKDKYIIQQPQKFGSIPACIHCKKSEKLKWLLYIDRPGKYNFDVSYNYQGDTNSKLTIRAKCNKQKLIHRVCNTGKTVGEPNYDWVINSFNPYKVGTFVFEKPGYYPIELDVRVYGKERLDFQWAYLKFTL